MPASELTPDPSEATPPDRTDAAQLRRGRRTHPLSGAVQGAMWAGVVIIAANLPSLKEEVVPDGPWWLGLLVIAGGGLVVGEVLGFLSWWFTRFVIDDAELRIDSGVLTRRSRRAAFERIQSVDVVEPLLARMVGLAEVRVDLAGGDESRLAVRFLPLDEARAVRRLLLRQAHGVPGAALDRPDGDHSVDDELDAGELITRVTPDRTLLGALLSLDLLLALAALGAILLSTLGFGAPLLVLGGVLPALSWAGSVVVRRVVAEWGFVLWRTPHGLRIERGLLSLTAQTIPYARVQGVAVVEPVLWRRLGWCRLEVDVAGRAGSDDGALDTTLLPIADRALAAALVAELVRDGGPDAEVVTVRASRRSWPFSPVGWRFRSLSLAPRRASSTTGWLRRRTSHAPHAKVQSFALRQGPLQRLRSLATVELHTPDGPVDVDVHHVDAARAREVVLRAVEVAREERAQTVAGSAPAGRVLGADVDGADEVP
ncbi:MAG: PH domain-containing protein [Propionibacteriales bacterium]|nr:PH domain-containing protein [Propionibacteriales bacterium]